MNEAQFEALLRDGLAPPSRAPDRAFLAQVDAALVEAARFRNWRAAILRQLSGEMLGLASIVGALAVAARAPAVRDVVGGAPELAGSAFLLVLLIAWLLLRGRADALA